MNKVTEIKKNVPNQPLNLAVITLELNNPERKCGTVGALESVCLFEYLITPLTTFLAK